MTEVIIDIYNARHIKEKDYIIIPLERGRELIQLTKNEKKSQGNSRK
ncbi:MAG: hypothetical protein NDF54_05340 [archaeon GB-1867-035]|nr:hypothetical protein [Candidatus Culexmicrobium profundum]